jgi:POT family proton-dependent oligopeptide transporter
MFTKKTLLWRRHEVDGLRRLAEQISTGAWFIVLTEFCECFAYCGGSAPFQSYVQFSPEDGRGQADALGKWPGSSYCVIEFLYFLLLRYSFAWGIRC